MIVVYNPLILFEGIAAGGISFGASEAFPGLSKPGGTLLTLGLLALFDVLLRYWLLRKKPVAPDPASTPLAPEAPPRDWGWMVSPRGGHFLFVPGWGIALIASSFLLIP